MSPSPPPLPTSANPQHLRQAIAALEAQRGLLGDAVTELALAPLRQLLAVVDATPKLRRAQVTVLFADIVGSPRWPAGWTPRTRSNSSAACCSVPPTACAPTAAACCASPATA